MYILYTHTHKHTNTHTHTHKHTHAYTPTLCGLISRYQNAAVAGNSYITHMKDVTYTHKLRHTHKQTMSRTRMSHVIQMNPSCHPLDRRAGD